MTGTRWQALAAAMALAGTLGCAGCTGTSPTPTPSPSPPLTISQVGPPLVQCFIDNKLIPAKALDTNAPLASRSYWLHDGRVIVNEHFGDWYRFVGVAVVVKGKIIGEWVTGVINDPRTWPAKLCGPLHPWQPGQRYA